MKFDPPSVSRARRALLLSSLLHRVNIQFENGALKVFVADSGIAVTAHAQGTDAGERRDPCVMLQLWRSDDDRNVRRAVGMGNGVTQGVGSQLDEVPYSAAEHRFDALPPADR
jgi:hypothetical protein